MFTARQHRLSFKLMTILPLFVQITATKPSQNNKGTHPLMSSSKKVELGVEGFLKYTHKGLAKPFASCKLYSNVNFTLIVFV